MPPVLENDRLRLLPASAALVDAEIRDRAAFARLIQADVPGNWPPENLAAALPLFLKALQSDPEHAGWFGWYVLTKDNAAAAPVLAASAGFLGPPRDGSVELGYSVLPQFQGRGIATEAAACLLRWAFDECAQLERVAAETEWSNPASVRLLSRLGFLAVGQGGGADGQRFVLSRARWLDAR